jgi:hypothetical protein
LSTVTEAVPVVAMSVAGMTACSWVDDVNVVTRSAPFHRTFAPETKLVPDTVRVKAEPPAVAKEGLRPVTTGVDTGAVTANVIALERPPSGLSTVTEAVPTAAISDARILA